MASLSKKLLDVAKNFLGGLIAGYKEDSKSLAKKTNSDLIGDIYKLIVSIDEKKRLEQNEASARKESQEEDEQERHNEIIKALSVRRKPKKKTVEIKKKLEEKKKPPEPGKKPGKPAKPEAPKPTEKPVEPKKPVEPAKPAPVKEVPAKPTAEPVKPAEVKPAATKIPKVAIATGATLGLTGREALAENISKYESDGAGYNAYNKGTVGNKMIPSDKPIDFSQMTIEEFLRRGDLKPGDPDRLFAVGKYQIIPATMKDLVKNLKLDPKTTTLDPGVQNLLFSKGLTKTRRKAVEEYISGKSDNIDAAILQLAQEFASVGVPYDTERVVPAHKDKNGNVVPEKRIKLKKGDSFYSGEGGNVAHNPPEQVASALQSDRLSYAKTSSLNSVPSSTGAQTSTLSGENNTIKQDMSHSSETNNTFFNNIIPGSSPQTTQKPKDVDDTNPMDRKRNQ